MKMDALDPSLLLADPRAAKFKLKPSQKPSYLTPPRDQKAIPDSAHRLKLKDYLRLTVLSKRSNSTSSKKGSIAHDQNSKNVNVQAEGQFDNDKSLAVMKAQLKADLSGCLQKLGEMLSKLQKNDFHQGNQQQKYEELIFLCEIHRKVREQIQVNIDKASNCMTEHRQSQFFKYAKNSQITPEDLKKSQISTRRKMNSLSTTRNRSNSNSNNTGTSNLMLSSVCQN